MKIISRFVKISLLCFASVALVVNAQSFVPSAAQIQQFKSLPRSQQEQLANQMGFDISLLDQVNGKKSQDQSEEKIDFVEREVNNQEISEELSKQSVVNDSASKLLPFGYDIFETREEAVGLSGNMPVPSNYVMGPGDSVKLQLFGKETGEFELSVTNEGTLDLPDLGPMQVTGISFQELKNLVQEKYKQQKIGVTSFVTMGRMRTIQIFLVGEVYRPGPLVVSGLSTVTTVLINSGGINTLGSLRNIELKRNGKRVAVFDLYNLIVKGDTSNDIRVEQGDVLFVPTARNIVSIEGQVRRPAIYELTEFETIQDLIGLAGGLLPKADGKSLQLVRKNLDSSLSIRNIDIADKKSTALQMQNGDFVRVPEANLEFSNAIIINGAINMPSIIADTGVMLSDVITKQTLYSTTDLNYALVIRKRRFDTTSTVLQFKPITVINGEYDLELQAFDELILFNKIGQDKVSGTESKVVEGDLQARIDQAKQEEANYLQVLESNRFSSQTFTRESNRKFSRKALLAPIIARLKSEASDKNRLQLVEVKGEVKYPGVYPRSNITSLRQVIDATGGLTEAAYLESAEITSSSLVSGILDVVHKRVNIMNQLLLPETQQVKLQSKDILNIVRIPQWYESNNIQLRGEVVFPGTYQITDGELLSNVIKRAGGLTHKASVNAAVFTRKELQEKERDNIQKAIEDIRQELATNSLSNNQFTKSVDYDSAREVLNDLSDFEPVGRMVIDITAILEGKIIADITVKDGDVLVIPNITPAISIIGEVFVPITHQYDPALTIEAYIELAGGIRDYGDASNVYIVKANGSIVRREGNFWFSGSTDYLLSAGDTIVIPREVNNHDNITLWQGITQILYQSAVAIAAIGSL